MSYNFEPITNKNYVGINTMDSFTVRWEKKKNGYFGGEIYFGGGMLEKANITGKKSVRTFKDDDNKVVAVEFNNDERDDCNRALRWNAKRPFMTSNSFIKLMVEDYGYPIKTKLSYKVIDNGLVVLLKDGVIKSQSEKGE